MKMLYKKSLRAFVARSLLPVIIISSTYTNTIVIYISFLGTFWRPKSYYQKINKNKTRKAFTTKIVTLLKKGWTYSNEINLVVRKYFNEKKIICCQN